MYDIRSRMSNYGLSQLFHILHNLFFIKGISISIRNTIHSDGFVAIFSSRSYIDLEFYFKGRVRITVKLLILIICDIDPEKTSLAVIFSSHEPTIRDDLQLRY